MACARARPRERMQLTDHFPAKGTLLLQTAQKRARPQPHPKCFHNGSLVLAQLGHQALGLGEGIDDMVVMENIVEGERTSFAVFEPLLGGLIAADVGVPCFFRHIAEILRVVEWSWRFCVCRRNSRSPPHASPCCNQPSP